MESESIHVDVHAVKRMLDENERFILLDCRQDEEHAFAHIEGDQLIPLDQLTQRCDELPKSGRIVVYCHLGTRSLMAAGWLRENGFDFAQSMTGGIDAWSTLVDGSIPRYT